MVYASPAQKNPSEYLLDGRHEQPELLKHKHREFKEQQLAQERIKEQQFLIARNEKWLKNTKQQKNSSKVAINDDDRAVLETLYNATGGDNWWDNTNWLTGDGSDWYGITLDENGRVTEIFLYGNELSGSIPAEIGNLTNLQSLTLSGNHLSGSIPAELGNLTNLQKLSLFSNQLSGGIPAVLGNLTNLQSLDLFSNQLGGSIPIELGNLTNLQSINLSNDQLSGSIPAELKNLTNLQSINLSSNQLSNSIPAELGNLTNLQSIELSHNQFSGSIPAELGNLTNLQNLYLSSNQLSGSIPAELKNLSNLIELHLKTNQFTNLPDLSALVNLSPWGTEVQNNSLDFGDLETSGISWSFYAPQAKIPISKNKHGDTITFRVSVDGTNNVYKWLKNDVEITGETTDSLAVNSTDEGIYYCEITNPNFPDLVLNSDIEEIGVLLTNGVITSEYNALIALYNATNGDNWTHNTNWKTTELVEYWYGVNVSRAHITKIKLNNNQLSGSIPAELGNLTNLQKLELFSNHLSGSIPTELGNLTNLQELYLENNQFTSLPDLSALVNLASWGTAVENNSLDFGNLETSSISWSSYAPQAKVNLSKNENGDTITFRVVVAGTNNIYKWLKNDVEISGETTDSLSVANTEDGFYYCEITNPDFPYLVLTSVVEGVGSVSITNGVITNEYNALIAFYNETNGDNWTHNTNWKTTELVDYWYGVNVSGAHITEIKLYGNQLSGSIPTDLKNLTNLQSLKLGSNQLSGNIPIELANLTYLQNLNLYNNQLSGSIPAELGKLTNLQSLDLNHNQLSGSIPAELRKLTNLQELYLENNEFTSLPDLSALVNLSYWATMVQNNSLDFGDLETAGIGWYYYAPQAKVGTEQTIELSEGEGKSISLSVAGSNNSYQWYKDGIAIDGAKGSFYTISNFTETTDTGVYVCKITNSYFPDLILESNSIMISKKITSAIDVKDDSQLSIYPNPVSDRLSIRFSKERAEILKILDLTGKQLFSRKVNSINESVNLSNLESGVYILQLKFENQTISKKIIKN